MVGWGLILAIRQIKSRRHLSKIWRLLGCVSSITIYFPSWYFVGQEEWVPIWEGGRRRRWWHSLLIGWLIWRSSNQMSEKPEVRNNIHDPVRVSARSYSNAVQTFTVCLPRDYPISKNFPSWNILHKLWNNITTQVMALNDKDLQGMAKRFRPGCVNAAGKLRQEW